METKVEALEGNRAKVTITLDAKDVDARIKNTYKEFANKYNFPGFRKGKAPRPIIDNALGKDAVRASVADEVVNGLSPIAIDEKGLFPISKPEFAEEPGLVEDGKPSASGMEGLVPYKVDNAVILAAGLSSRFAHQIEALTSEEDAFSLQKEMAHKYCLLVKNHSMKGYSLLIRKVLTRIDSDLTADLSLKSQAELLGVNSSYLSTLFKKETGSTLTE